MMKVIHLITCLNVGGAEIMLAKLLSKIDRSQVKPVVISLSDSGTVGHLIEKLGISVYAADMNRGRPTLKPICRVISMARNLKPDIIQGWMYHGNLAAQLCAALCSDSPPVIWNIRQSLYSLGWEKRMTAAIVRAGSYISRFPKHIVYNSETSAEQHEALGYRRNKRVIIPNGFDTEIFKPSTEAYKGIRKELNIPPDSMVIGLIARYHHKKDHPNFIIAAASVIKAYPSTHFILAGNRVDEKNRILMQDIYDFNLLKNVHLLGERSDIPRITAGLDISSSSSYSEAFPNVIGEAMACGVPCVVTDVGDSAWLVGNTGRIVPARNPEALARAWTELVEMGVEQRRILGGRARQRVLDSFSLDTVVKRYERLYLDVLGKEN